MCVREQSLGLLYYRKVEERGLSSVQMGAEQVNSVTQLESLKDNVHQGIKTPGEWNQAR